MNTVKLRKILSISPEFLTEDFEENVLRKLKNRYEGICNKENGYIEKVGNNIQILNNAVSNDGYVLLDVVFDVHTLKPAPKMVLQGRVIMINEDGVFLNIKNRFIQVAIPENYLEFKYDSYENNYISSEGEKISIDSRLEVVIENISFVKDKYVCIAHLKNIIRNIK